MNETIPPDELPAETIDALDRSERNQAFGDGPIVYISRENHRALIRSARLAAARGERVRELADIVHSNLNEGDKITRLLALLVKP